jgi:DNA-binding transcriptional LysR family regulator
LFLRTQLTSASRAAVSITRYRYFFKVARLGSIREASEVLHVAPSAISRQIAKLEEELGTDLLEPNGRGIRLTAAGEILAMRASQMVDALEQARSEIDDLVGLRRGHVHIWTVEGSVGDLVLPTVNEFQRRYPAVSYEITVAGSDRIARAVMEDDADIGVIFNPPEEPGLREVARVTGSLLAIGHPGHAAMKLRSLSMAEMAKYPLALPDTSFGLRHMVDAAAKAARVEPAPVLVTNSIEALREFARIGAGLTILPRTAVQGDIRRRLLRAIPLTDKPFRVVTTAIVVRRDRQLPIAATEFAAQFAEVTRNLGL